jgi:hypothetical protein
MTAVDENAKSLPPADGTAADIPLERVQAELADLRKGAGVEEPALARRIGPYLRELASLGGQPRDSAALRRQLRAELTACASRLPAEARIAVTAGLALSDATRQAKLIGRKLWLAKALSVSPRTAQRRLDDGEALLAEEVALELRGSRGRAATTPVGWYLQELRVVLQLDGEVVESIEERSIVATRPQLDEVMAWVVIPGDKPGQSGPTPVVKVLRGGRLLRTEQPSPGKYVTHIRLDQPLAAGQRGEYGLKLILNDPMAMRPHYVFVPEYPCEAFDLTVRFEPTRPPAWVRKINGEQVRVFDATVPPARPLQVSDSGEVRATFTRLTLNLGYGLQWQP